MQERRPESGAGGWQGGLAALAHGRGEWRLGRRGIARDKGRYVALNEKL